MPTKQRSVETVPTIIDQERAPKSATAKKPDEMKVLENEYGQKDPTAITMRKLDEVDTDVINSRQESQKNTSVLTPMEGPHLEVISHKKKRKRSKGKRTMERSSSDPYLEIS